MAGCGPTDDETVVRSGSGEIDDSPSPRPTGQSGRDRSHYRFWARSFSTAEKKCAQILS
jgi:hypothetical protein